MNVAYFRLLIKFSKRFNGGICNRKGEYLQYSTKGFNFFSGYIFCNWLGVYYVNVITLTVLIYCHKRIDAK